MSTKSATGLLSQPGKALKLAGAWLNQGKRPYVFIVLYLALGTGLVYASPRDLPSFLIFLSSILLVYFMRLDTRVKFGLMLLFGLGVTIVSLQRMKIFQAVKMGETV